MWRPAWLLLVSTSVLTALLAAGALARSTASPSPRLPDAWRCPVFPPNNHWNVRVDRLPVAANSQTLIAAIGLDQELHADFGSGLSTQYGGRIGIPYVVVGRRQKRVRVKFRYASASDRGPYPIPRNIPIQAGHASTGDRHAIIVDRDRCRLYELYDLHATTSGWRAGSGAIWNLRSNRLRPDGWTSADAAGLPILPGLVRYDEVARGNIAHALRFTAERTRKAHIYPARHHASDSTDPRLPPMGLRVRLRRNFDISSFPPQTRVILVALKRYGMLLADNGRSWDLGGVPSEGWNNEDLDALERVKGGAFEVVDTSSLPTPGTRKRD